MPQAWKKYFDPQTLTSLGDLRLRSHRPLGGSIAGEHRSHRMGQAMEFAQHRQYTPGDDLRYIDWKIYGRTDKFFLKQSEDETNLTCYIVTDCSESMGFSGDAAKLTKLEYAKRLAFALMIVGVGQNDPVGCAFASDQLTHYLPPANSPVQFSLLEDALESIDAVGETDLPRAIQQLLEVANSRGLIILISDLLGDHDMQSLATILGASGHDVIVLHVMDRDEHDFSLSGEVRFLGLETGETLEVNGDRIAKAYRQEVASFIRSQQQACWERGMGYHTTITDQSIIGNLAAALGR